MSSRNAAARLRVQNALARTKLVASNAPASYRPASPEAIAHPSLDLRFALTFFAEHGLGSAMAARRKAEAAYRSGQSGAFAKWLAVCRSFDAAMALDLEHALDSASRN